MRTMPRLRRLSFSAVHLTKAAIMSLLEQARGLRECIITEPRKPLGNDVIAIGKAHGVRVRVFAKSGLNSFETEE